MVDTVLASDRRTTGGKISQEGAGGLRDLLTGPLRVRSVSVQILLLLAVFYTLYVARSLFIAIVFALILKGALVRPVRFLKRLRIPTPVGAALVLATLLGSLGFATYSLADPAANWIDDLPRNLAKLEYRLTPLSAPVEKVSKQVEAIAQSTDVAEPLKVEIASEPSILNRVGSSAWSFAVNLLITVVLLYFLLVTDEAFLRKVVLLLPRLSDKRLAVETGRAIEQRISTYLLTITVINLCLGGVLAGVFAVLGLPNPILFGAMACLLNFIPYVGALVGIAVVSAVSLLTFDALGAAALPPAAYFVATILEGMIISPHVLGRSLALSPVAIFLWLLLWTFLWGIPGALLAVPLLAILKIVCDNVPSLEPVGVFIAD